MLMYIAGSLFDLSVQLRLCCRPQLQYRECEGINKFLVSEKKLKFHIPHFFIVVLHHAHTRENNVFTLHTLHGKHKPLCFSTLYYVE